ncbi:MAG: hypothetical protein ACFFCW_07155 [Candidatus Hodarchaeota archaeon]
MSTHANLKKHKRTFWKCLAKNVLFLIFVLSTFFTNLSCDKSERDKSVNEKIPQWVVSGSPISASSIPSSDYSFLAQWLDENAKSAQEYMIDLFKDYQVVICGEGHNVKEHKDFIIELIPLLYHDAGVRCIGWEFTRYSDNERLEKILTASEYSSEAVLQLARDQLAHTWNSREHWDIIKAVWQLNKSLEQNQEKMRLLGLHGNLDLVQAFMVFRTKSEDSPEFREAVDKLIQEHDVAMAQNVEKEIIEKDLKALIFVGRCHDFTHYEFPPNMNFGRPIMGNLLYKRHEELIFQVWLGAGFLRPIEEVMKIGGNEYLGFDLYKSPFANILSPDGWDAPKVPLSKIARGYIYLKPRNSMHKNTSIKGFVTDEMFKKYKQYYETDLERTFNSAQELDEHLQKNRFPKP